MPVARAMADEASLEVDLLIKETMVNIVDEISRTESLNVEQTLQQSSGEDALQEEQGLCNDNDLVLEASRRYAEWFGDGCLTEFLLPNHGHVPYWDLELIMRLEGACSQHRFGSRSTSKPAKCNRLKTIPSRSPDAFTKDLLQVLEEIKPVHSDTTCLDSARAKAKPKRPRSRPPSSQQRRAGRRFMHPQQPQ